MPTRSMFLEVKGKWKENKKEKKLEFWIILLFMSCVASWHFFDIVMGVWVIWCDSTNTLLDYKHNQGDKWLFLGVWSCTVLSLWHVCTCILKVLIQNEYVNGVRMFGAQLKGASVYKCANMNCNRPSGPLCFSSPKQTFAFNHSPIWVSIIALKTCFFLFFSQFSYDIRVSLSGS